jgi:hypothetical protein
MPSPWRWSELKKVHVSRRGLSSETIAELQAQFKEEAHFY